MKVLEFRQLIREEVRKVLKEARYSRINPNTPYVLVIDAGANFSSFDLPTYAEMAKFNLENAKKIPASEVLNYPNTKEVWKDMPQDSKWRASLAKEDRKWKAEVAKLGTNFDYYHDIPSDREPKAIIVAIPKGTKISDYNQFSKKVRKAVKQPNFTSIEPQKVLKQANSMIIEPGVSYALVVDEDGNFLMEKLKSYAKKSYFDFRNGAVKLAPAKVQNYANSVEAWANAEDLESSENAKWKEAVKKFDVNKYDFYDVTWEGGENVVVAAVPKGTRPSKK